MNGSRWATRWRVMCVFTMRIDKWVFNKITPEKFYIEIYNVLHIYHVDNDWHFRITSSYAGRQILTSSAATDMLTSSVTTVFVRYPSCADIVRHSRLFAISVMCWHRPSQPSFCDIRHVLTSSVMASFLRYPSPVDIVCHSRLFVISVTCWHLTLSVVRHSLVCDSRHMLTS